MEEILHILLHTLKHSAILLPFLFVAYILIEIIEFYSSTKLEHSRLLSNKWSTVFGASFGLIPQCGFSVVATDLFSQKKIKLGTLLAVYIATSDEAIPLLLTTPNKALSLLPLILIKFIVAIIVGYAVDFILSKNINKSHKTISKNLSNNNSEIINNEENHKHPHDHKHDNNHNNEEHNHEDSEELTTSEIHTGCCGHQINKEFTKKEKAKQFLIHPLIHSLKIFAFIFIVTFIFNGFIEWLGEDKISFFLKQSKNFAPLVSAFIGLIPNCASSVVITNLYTIGGISFGALVSGLIVNAGIAFVVLFKQNKNIKQNFFILGLMLSVGISVGYIIQLIGF